MTLSAPTFVVFVVSVVLFALSVLSYVVRIPLMTPYVYWLAVAAYVVLAAGVLLKRT